MMVGRLCQKCEGRFLVPVQLWSRYTQKPTENLFFNLQKGVWILYIVTVSCLLTTVCSRIDSCCHLFSILHPGVKAHMKSLITHTVYCWGRGGCLQSVLFLGLDCDWREWLQDGLIVSLFKVQGFVWGQREKKEEERSVLQSCHLIHSHTQL